jgi:hypothetical protein
MIAPMRTIDRGARRQGAAVAALLAALAGCGGEAPRWDLQLRPAAEQPAEEIGLVFGWPLPGNALVRESVARGGFAFTVRYRLRSEADGDGRVVRSEGLELVEIDGRPAASGDEGRALDPLLESIGAAMPAIRVGADGRYLGVLDYEAWTERAVAAVETQLRGETREEVLRALRARIELLRAKTMRPALERGAGERWEAWVGSWIGLAGAPGASVTRRTHTVLPWAPTGTEVELPARIRGHVVRPATHVRVEMVGDLEPRVGGGDPLTGMLARAFGPEVEGLRARFGRGAVLDPATLCPLYVESRLRIVRDAEDGPAGSEEVRIWEFDWGSAADGG